MTELNETAERNATMMTGEERPKFKSATERHRTIHENYMGTMIRFWQAANFVQGEMLELLREGVGLLRRLVAQKEGGDGEQ